ncbi:MAG: ROK family protein [Motilibacteraceae bacterium]
MRARSGGAPGVSSLRRDNAALIAQHVLQEPGASRSDLCVVTGLSPGAVTKIVSSLLEEGVVQEGSPALSSVGGRPRVPLYPAPGRYRLAGVHIGLRWCIGALVDLSGTVRHEELLQHDDLSPASVLANVGRLLDRLERAAGSHRLVGAGVSSGGWVDPGSALVHAHPGMGWRDVDLAAVVDGRQYPVQVDSTVRALAAAESLFGASRGVSDSVQVFIGNSVGVAVTIGGEVQVGAHAAAGVIDHLPVLTSPTRHGRCRCGRSGCLVSVATDRAVTARAQQAGVITYDQQFEDLLEIWRDGDRAADRLLKARARAVGRACALVMDLVDPALLVVSGNVAQAEHLSDLREGADEYADRRGAAADRIVLTGLGDNALSRAPASVALVAFYRDPLQASVAD